MKVLFIALTALAHPSIILGIGIVGAPNKTWGTEGLLGLRTNAFSGASLTYQLRYGNTSSAHQPLAGGLDIQHQDNSLGLEIAIASLTNNGLTPTLTLGGGAISRTTHATADKIISNTDALNVSHIIPFFSAQVGASLNFDPTFAIEPFLRSAKNFSDPGLLWSYGATAKVHL